MPKTIKHERERELKGFTPLEALGIKISKKFLCWRAEFQRAAYSYFRRQKSFKDRDRLLTGFTLIELLIVIAIIGTLAGILFVSIGQGPLKKARDARRMSDMKQIQLALALYFDKYERYPNAAHSGCYDGWETTCDVAGNFIDELRVEGFLSKVPFDPINISTGYGVGNFYGYYRYAAGVNGCSFPHAVLAINEFESSNPNKGISAQCPGRDWYPEWDYSIMLRE